MRQGFSLVELSIVLVILGLLTGGILAGQSLIRAAELRAVTTEFNRYLTAVNAFQDKYFALPGDMTNATSVWGISTNCSGASSTGTCNGNGNGAMEQAAAVSTTGEDFQFWNQLALAGLIEGTYTGLAGPTAGNTGLDTVPGVNSPKSKMNNAGWGVRYIPSYAGDTVVYASDYGNLLSFGAKGSGDWNNGAVLKPEEAWNVDTKMDDGKPGTGKVFVIQWTNCTTSASKTDYTGSYALSSSTVSCGLMFPKPF